MLSEDNIASGLDSLLVLVFLRFALVSVLDDFIESTGQQIDKKRRIQCCPRTTSHWIRFLTGPTLLWVCLGLLVIFLIGRSFP